MVGQHVVYMQGGEVGRVTIAEEGLYYRIIARCKLPVDKYRLRLSFHERELDLGLLVPNENRMVLNKYIPKKHLSGHDPKFSLQSTKATSYMLLDPEQPFGHLSSLNRTKLVFMDGKHALQFQS